MENLQWFEWNPFLFKKLTPMINKGWTFVDIGANHGEFTDFFKEFSYKRIYSFELNPITAEVLKNKYKEFPCITVENYAVCDKNGVVDFYDGGKTKSDTCYNILGHNMDFETTEKIGHIKSIRLDTYFGNTKIDLIKIDVEGAELLVLEGLKSLIKNIGLLLIECHLDKDWETLRGILLNDLKLQCINFYDNSIISDSSPRPYQCLCKHIGY